MRAREDRGIMGFYIFLFVFLFGLSYLHTKGQMDRRTKLFSDASQDKTKTRDGISN